MSDTSSAVISNARFECWSDDELKAMGIVPPRYRREIAMEAAQERTRVSRQRKRPKAQAELVSRDKGAPAPDLSMGDPRFPRRRKEQYENA